MRFKKKESAHVEERVVNSRETCDSCGVEIDEHPGIYEWNEVNIEAHIGSMYPEGDSRTAYEIDVCTKCFVDKLVPLMRANGFPVRERDSGLTDERVWEPEA